MFNIKAVDMYADENISVWERQEVTVSAFILCKAI
jgi:hypothetical protein